MILFLKIILIAAFFTVLYQDSKERMIDWPLILIIALCGGILHFFEVMPITFWLSVLINLITISVFILGMALYLLFKKKWKFKEVIGLGDIILFIALAFSFSSVSFMIIFISAIVFSILLSVLYKQNSLKKTIPLAGYMSAFFAFTYLGFWLGFTEVLYNI